MVKITFYETKPWEEKYLKSKFKNHSLKFYSEPLSEKNIEKNSEIISVFIYSKIDKSIIDKFTKLKLITTRSTGFDHIDIKYSSKKGIVVSSVPSYGENTVAEHAFALILTLSRNIHKSYVRTLRDDFSIDGLTGFDLKDKTIGIIGAGHIGLHLARIARAFGMHVRVYDIKRDNFLSEAINYKYVSLNELLAVSDIVSLHAPYNDKTHHLINKKTIFKMKDGAILINTSRGALVDTDALYFALKNKKLGGAGLDVIEGEELIKEDHQLLDDDKNQVKWRSVVRDQKLFDMENVVFTPHNAFNSKESLIRILDTTIRNISSFLKNEPQNKII